MDRWPILIGCTFLAACQYDIEKQNGMAQKMCNKWLQSIALFIFLFHCSVFLQSLS